MIINVRVKSGHSEKKIEPFGNSRYLVYLTEPAENNRANIQLINMLSKHFGIPAGRIKIKTGMTDRDKMIELS